MIPTWSPASNCGATPLTAFAANSPVADFHCGVCAEAYELKATKGPHRRRDLTLLPLREKVAAEG